MSETDGQGRVEQDRMRGRAAYILDMMADALVYVAMTEDAYLLFKGSIFESATARAK